MGEFISIPYAFTTSSYWIEGPTGLIVIGTQFLPSSAEALIEAAESKTGKPVKLAFVLHPNPDKFNGVATFQAHGAKVVTSDQVLALIPAVHAQRRAKFYEGHKPDYPYETPTPESFGAETTQVSAGGVTVTAHVLGGPGCSEAHVLLTPTRGSGPTPWTMRSGAHIASMVPSSRVFQTRAYHSCTHATSGLSTLMMLSPLQ